RGLRRGGGRAPLPRPPPPQPPSRPPPHRRHAAGTQHLPQHIPAAQDLRSRHHGTVLHHSSASPAPSATLPTKRLGRYGRVTTSQAPSGRSTAATTWSTTRGPGSTLTRITGPATAPGNVPAMSTRASQPPV